ncbi:MAG: hypothetical protein ABR499_12155 [Gemmatimonadaceae bacterium]
MRSFFEWFAAQPPDTTARWVIFGKGPSFARRAEFDLSGYRSLSLNHVVRDQPVDVAHAIDVDVVEACEAELERNASVVVLPWYPHRRNRAGNLTLVEWAERLPVLQRLREAGRLLWYDLGTTRRRHGSGPVVPAPYFSAEAALSLLALAGAREVRSLGVDGGSSYSREFGDLRDKTLLNNGHKSFDTQFQGFARTIMQTGIDYAPLGIESPIRIFVGSTPAQMLAVKVLEYSVRKHASMSVEVFPLFQAPLEYPTPKDPANRPRTPFSFQRFVIPSLKGFRGRAIYLDSDMQVFRDVREVWTLPFNGADLLAAREPDGTGRRPQFSVMLLDCERLRWDLTQIVARLDSGELDYEKLMYRMAVAETIDAAIDPHWNSLERYEEGRTSLLHYTDMNRQPWISPDNKLNYLWTRDLCEAIDRGVIARDYVASEVAAGNVRPSLLYQVDHRVEDTALLPKPARALDAGFVPPHRRDAGALASMRVNPIRVARAVLRSLYQRTFFPDLERRIRRYVRA